jgi:hypothetical protein
VHLAVRVDGPRTIAGYHCLVLNEPGSDTRGAILGTVSEARANAKNFVEGRKRKGQRATRSPPSRPDARVETA